MRAERRVVLAPQLLHGLQSELAQLWAAAVATGTAEGRRRARHRVRPQVCQRARAQVEEHPQRRLPTDGEATAPPADGRGKLRIYASVDARDLQRRLNTTRCVRTRELSVKSRFFTVVVSSLKQNS